MANPEREMLCLGNRPANQLTLRPIRLLTGGTNERRTAVQVRGRSLLARSVNMVFHTRRHTPQVICNLTHTSDTLSYRSHIIPYGAYKVVAALTAR